MLTNGLACSALFFNTGQIQRSPRVAALSCETSGKGGILAGADGAIAAKAIHAELLAEDGLC